MIPSLAVREDRIVFGLTCVFSAIAGALTTHYAPLFSGDAAIHLVFMENASRGAWFQFNEGTPDPSSTSPLWTVIGACLIRLGGLAFGLVAIKVLCVLVWLCAGVLVFLNARELGASSRYSYLAAALALALPSSASNALLGMENGAFAALVLAAMWAHRRAPARKGIPTAGVFALIGLAIALRPEGAIVFAVILAARRRDLAATWHWAALALACTAGVCLGWYAFTTGHLVPGSGISRVMLARRASTSFHLGPLWVYGAPIVRLALFTPLAAAAWLARRRDWTMAATAICGVVAYSFVIGGANTSRYMIWVFALLLPLAAAEAEGRKAWTLAAVAWLTLSVTAEAYARVVAEVFGGRGYTVEDLIDASRHRKENTEDLLHAIDRGGCHPRRPEIALVEVQERFWLDDRVSVASLDGTTAAARGHPVSYESDGCPRIEPVFTDPDVVAIAVNPERPIPGCYRQGPVAAFVQSWGSDALPEWLWDGDMGMMVRRCR